MSLTRVVMPCGKVVPVLNRIGIRSCIYIPSGERGKVLRMHDDYKKKSNHTFLKSAALGRRSFLNDHVQDIRILPKLFLYLLERNVTRKSLCSKSYEGYLTDSLSSDIHVLHAIDGRIRLSEVLGHNRTSCFETRCQI